MFGDLGRDVFRADGDGAGGVSGVRVVDRFGAPVSLGCSVMPGSVSERTTRFMYPCVVEEVSCRVTADPEYAGRLRVGVVMSQRDRVRGRGDDGVSRRIIHKFIAVVDVTGVGSVAVSSSVAVPVVGGTGAGERQWARADEVGAALSEGDLVLVQVDGFGNWRGGWRPGAAFGTGVRR